MISFESLRLIPKLGWRNVAAVLVHRVRCRFGLYPTLREKFDFTDGAFVGTNPRELTLKDPDYFLQRAENLIAGSYQFFGKHDLDVSYPPNWFEDPFTKTSLDKNKTVFWSKINEFQLEGVDIKNIWDISRFAWAVDLAIAYSLSHDDKFLTCLNSWVSDWQGSNPPGFGINWKCAQEASIRLLNLCLAKYLLGEHLVPSPQFESFLRVHLERIAQTTTYAHAQQNNHATSEALALAVGGALLSKLCKNSKAHGARLSKLGRKNLEKFFYLLICKDGSFSQRSMNYHRMLLDTVSMWLFWSRELEISPLGAKAHQRMHAATEWVFQMVEPQTGCVPNFGHNDGTLLLNLSNCDYRDYRPAVQLASALIAGTTLYPPGVYDDALSLLGIRNCKQEVRSRVSTDFKDGGYVTMVLGDVFVFIHAPNFKFRPAHSDVFHIDVWKGTKNILTDSGTYRYNAESRYLSYFPGAAAHNVVQFGDRDQMPRVSRFLFGRWPRVKTLTALNSNEGFIEWAGAFTDWESNLHKRKVKVSANAVVVDDEILSKARKSTLLWHLNSDDWKQIDNTVKSVSARLEIERSDLELQESSASQYYAEVHQSQTIRAPISAKARTKLMFCANS